MLNQYYFTELHAHTWPASSCSEFTPKELIDRYMQVGIDSVVICNHFYCNQRGYHDKDFFLKQYLQNYYETVEEGKKVGIDVIFGCEIRFANENNNDYLLFGIDPEYVYEAYDYLEGNLEKFSKAFRKEGRLLIQAHPFRSGCTPADPTLIDGVETFNMHPKHNNVQALASKFASQHQLIATCGTDFHHEGHQGMASLITRERMVNSQNIVDVLASRNYLFRVWDNVIDPYGYLKLQK